ncbi:DeoR/GlpR family DNA-binding transcription regulator [Microbacterium horticulturae]|uniref:Lactose phosphotransferase system repressor n=1 Tax=Microbacterium horticulturae TaxID=3028316 RepID=A0ABY8C0J6_9MICO|nr:DeoR/GlpR family DNA-binding transcription regulator [Microbacterium sp. KACC 23027]WEG08760.1 DeoR/GlpR family DNA-binding transcription regulator [Microbacterium sp. KACC 23027]
MYATERHELIGQVLTAEGRVGVHDLAARFDVTTETVRRDLDVLERAGRLRRVHGGAVPIERGSTVETTITERIRRHAREKSAIAARALEAIDEGFRGSLFLDAGSTTAAIAEQLAARLLTVHATAAVVTHSLTLAPALAAVNEVTLTVVGGRVRRDTAAAVGASTVRAIEALRPDIVFVGANGVSSSFGLSTPDPEEAAVKEAIVHAARRVIVVADAGKFEAESLVRFAALDDIDVLVTDTAPTGDLAVALESADVEVWVA